ncbi:MAG: endopeptidase La [Deltaproteobacteria bacterium]|nr:MAG: endopeptidase La [Deltaproteobacteria bacterium]
MSDTKSREWVPTGAFPMLALRQGVLFPGTYTTLPVGRERSRALVQELKPDQIIGVVTQRDVNTEVPGPADFHHIGVWVRVQRIGKMRGHYQLTVEGLQRFKLKQVVREEPYAMAEGELLEDIKADTQETQVLAEGLQEQIMKLAEEAGFEVKNLPEDPATLADTIAALLDLPAEQELDVLFTLNVAERLRTVARLAGETLTRTELKQTISREVERGMSKHQRDAMLREQLRAIKKELGEGEEGDELDKLRTKLDEAELPEDVQEVADRELSRLEGMPRGHAEANVIRNYLELLADLPWNKRSDVQDDINVVSDQLDKDHYGMGDVKRRILEHMAVAKMSGNHRGMILCFAGPPGVGKTSLGQSIATSTGREFVRIALGGVRDEAEIRGHRRTYIGALPGRLIKGLKKAKTKNPVILLDEIDKLAKGWSGDPEAALLEVLDPEQNSTFTDHYLEQPFDLSEVLFICTANTLETISAPLRDRLDIVEVSGYTSLEKQHIARQHLLPKQLDESGIHESHLILSDNALQAMIRDYTRESGVRQLNREIQKLCRGVTLDMLRDADTKAKTFHIEESDLGKYLGKPKFYNEVAERTAIPGVATGLAWTPTGGDILFIETTRMPGKGKLEITGKLGEVMQESARAALTYIRSFAEELNVDPHFLDNYDIHIHVPAGAVPKDGPSAGVSMLSALTSSLTGRKVRSDTAMTGEITLRGRVLPVGGVKAKVLAAHRAGITRVILPKRNERDLDDVPQDVRDSLEFFFAEDMKEVIGWALEKTSQVGNVDPSKESSNSLAA